MPNRILKESICTSDTLAPLSWFEEVLFYRLLVSCDDFGRFDGRTAVIKNRLFPLEERLTMDEVSSALQRLAGAGLIRPYTAEGKELIEVISWEKHQRIRSKRSKYPPPEDECPQRDSNCCHMTADVAVIQSNPNPNPNPNPTPAPPEAAGGQYVLFAKGDEKLLGALTGYEQARRSMGRPLNDQARTLLLQRLQELSRSPREQTEILNRSARSGWTDLYPLPQSRAAPAGRAGPLTETSADAPSELERRMVRPLAEGSENLT